jgi:hypothetical protein
MQVIKSHQIRSLCFLLLSAFSLTGCHDIELKSTWLDREIQIDGKLNDWENVLMIIRDKNATVGLSNDGNFLYLCLFSSQESTLRQAMMTGFTVWFDAEGGKQKRLGIRFPVGMQREDIPMRDMTTIQDTAVQKKLIDASLKEVEIIGPAKKEVATAANFLDQGIEVDVGQIQGKFAYELKIPLLKTPDQPYAVGVQEGKPIMIGFETGKIDREKMREEMMKGGRPPGGGGIGGRMPGGGRGPGGVGMGGPGGRPEMPKPLELWVKVYLAAEHSSGTEVQ